MTQDQALNILKTGANVFLTGEPGSGKTYVVNKYIEYLQEHGVYPSITASTGIAATHIGGVTIHSWSGIGVATQIGAHEITKIKSTKWIAKRITNAKVLIIDEVSMLAANFMDMLDLVCKRVRESDAPYGGLQVVLVGDFFQLPPVTRKLAPNPQSALIAPDEKLFAFQSEAWESAKFSVCYLAEQHRQSEEKLTAILGAIRSNKVEPHHIEALSATSGGEVTENETFLYSLNVNVDTLNKTMLDGLREETFVFKMTSSGHELVAAILKKSCLSPETLELKVGARVMFTKNHKMGQYVNGTIGVVEYFDPQSNLPVVKVLKTGQHITVSHDTWEIESEGKAVASIMQLPLRLAWAITVHKSQGMTLDYATLDLGSCFEYGQGYVALSRVATLQGLRVMAANEMAFKVNPQILLEDVRLRAASDSSLARLANFDATELSREQASFLQKIGGTKDKKPKKEEGITLSVTRSYIAQQLTIPEIAKKREMAVTTISSHVEQLLEKFMITKSDIEYLLPEPQRLAKIREALLQVKTNDGLIKLSPARAILGESYGYEELKIVRAYITDVV